jgi:UDP-glucose 4-epimerase
LLNNQHVLVTGGAGFIGSHLVDSLVEHGNNVLIIDNLISSTMKYIEPHIKSGVIKFIQGDIRDATMLLNINEPVDYIFHLAADPDVRESVHTPLISFDHNVQGTMNVLELARRKKVKGFIFASSGGTLYGDVESFPITENALLKPISPYGASKAAGEMYISAYANAYNFKAVSLRLANIFGERSNHGVSYDFFWKLTDNPKKMVILGDGLQKKSYLHISDCVKAFLRIAQNLETQKPAYDYYNIGTDEWVSVTDLAKTMEKLMGLSDVKHEYTGGKKGWVGDVHKLLLSIDKVKELGWIPTLTFEQGLERYVKWLRTQ